MTRTRELTWPAFCQIRHGDVILTGGVRPRLVLSGPADETDWYGRPRQFDPQRPTSKASVTLPIHARSWTNRAFTIINFYDLTTGTYARPGPSRWYRPTTARGICAAERDILAALGFDWVREVARELAEDAAIVQRLRRVDPDVADREPGVARWLQRFAARAARGLRK